MHVSSFYTVNLHIRNSCEIEANVACYVESIYHNTYTTALPYGEPQVLHNTSATKIQHKMLSLRIGKACFTLPEYREIRCLRLLCNQNAHQGRYPPFFH